MDDKIVKFNKFEKLFFRINLGIFGLSIFIYFLYLWLIEQLGPITDLIMSVIFVGMISTVIIFFISVIRIIKYVVTHRSGETSTIWRSILNIFLSPLSLIIFYILVFITALSSCTYAG